jgi:hypothetical protein
MEHFSKGDNKLVIPDNLESEFYLLVENCVESHKKKFWTSI